MRLLMKKYKAQFLDFKLLCVTYKVLYGLYLTRIIMYNQMV